MNILILGGTQFVGRHLVEAAVAAGHRVTTFNRGRTNTGLFPDIEKLCGNRDENLEALKDRSWDAAIDVSGYFPAQVQVAASLLAKAVDHFTFISSISVYRDFSQAGLNEDSPLVLPPPGSNSNEQYGVNKAQCELAAESAMPGRVLNIRPGIIVGPHDPTDRFTSWVRRVALGGEILCPGRPETPVQIIDARDLAGWIVDMIQAGVAGCFNATGPAERLTFGQMLEQCHVDSSNSGRFVWVDEEFLLNQKMNLSNELPLWIPDREQNYAGFFSIDCRRALKTGLRFRPLKETAQDILKVENSGDNPPSATVRGLDLHRESGLLTSWKTRICV